MSGTKKIDVEKIARKCEEKFSWRLADGRIGNAKEADEAAAEIAGDTNLPHDSQAFEYVLSKLYQIAGEAFPGEWEQGKKRQ